MTYQPTFVSQFDGSKYQGLNCTCAAAAMMLDRHTHGRIKTTGAHIRSCQDDQIGGTDLSDMKQAWKRCYNENLDVAGVIPFSDFIREVKRGRGAIITGYYGLLGDKYRHQKNFYGNHAMAVNEINPSGWLYNYDPIWHSPEWIPATNIKHFAGGLQGRLGRSRLGEGLIYVAFTRPDGPMQLPTPTPPPVPKDQNVMITQGGLTTTSSHVMSLEKDTKLFKFPGGPVVTRMAKAGDVPYFGIAGSGWRAVRVATGNPYADKIPRPTLLYVPASAGPVAPKE